MRRVSEEQPPYDEPVTGEGFPLHLMDSPFRRERHHRLMAKHAASACPPRVEPDASLPPPQRSGKKPHRANLARKSTAKNKALYLDRKVARLAAHVAAQTSTTNRTRYYVPSRPVNPPDLDGLDTIDLEDADFAAPWIMSLAQPELVGHTSVAYKPVEDREGDAASLYWVGPFLLVPKSTETTQPESTGDIVDMVIEPGAARVMAPLQDRPAVGRRKPKRAARSHYSTRKRKRTSSPAAAWSENSSSTVVPVAKPVSDNSGEASVVSDVTGAGALGNTTAVVATDVGRTELPTIPETDIGVPDVRPDEVDEVDSASIGPTDNLALLAATAVGNMEPRTVVPAPIGTHPVPDVVIVDDDVAEPPPRTFFTLGASTQPSAEQILDMMAVAGVKVATGRDDANLTVDQMLAEQLSQPVDAVDARLKTRSRSPTRRRPGVRQSARDVWRECIQSLPLGSTQPEESASMDDFAHLVESSEDEDVSLSALRSRLLRLQTAGSDIDTTTPDTEDSRDADSADGESEDGSDSDDSVPPPLVSPSRKGSRPRTLAQLQARNLRRTRGKVAPEAEELALSLYPVNSTISSGELNVAEPMARYRR